MMNTCDCKALRYKSPDLVVNKIYSVNPLEGNLIRVIDGAGEVAVYDSEDFLYVGFPPKVERVLSRLGKA